MNIGKSHVKIQFYTDETLKASISRRRVDARNDIAVLILDNLPNSITNVMPWGDSKALRDTQLLYAIGHPQPFGPVWAVTQGNISRITSVDIYLSGASIIKGYSGGPLLNNDGEMVGMIKEDQGAISIALSEELIHPIIRRWIEETLWEKPISKECNYEKAATDYSNCIFDQFDRFYNWINPEGFNFSNATGLPEWIRKGLDKNGKYSQHALIIAIRNGFKNLQGANLEGASLNDLDLEKANLEYANLKGVDLQRARLQNAKLKHTILQGAIWTDGQKCRIGSIGKCIR